MAEADNTERTDLSEDEFWRAMERKPDYMAFLKRFAGPDIKNYRLISPQTWARWDQVNLTFQSEDAFWSQMERQPDLQTLVGRYGGYPRISPETWPRWDAANAEYQARRRVVLG